MMVLSQGAMTLGAIAWGMSAQIAGTRLTLLAAALLFCVTAVVSMLLFSIPESRRAHLAEQLWIQERRIRRTTPQEALQRIRS